MARKDLEKETERPRYYSQFWLDVAAGRRVIGGGKSAQEDEDGEASEVEAAPDMSAKAANAPKGTATSPVVEAEQPARRAAGQPLRLSGAESLADLAAAAGLIDLESREDISDLEEENVAKDLEPLPEETAEEVDLMGEPEEETYSFADLYEEDEDEEDEDEDGWSSSRRGKKPKKQEKPRRREKGRDF